VKKKSTYPICPKVRLELLPNQQLKALEDDPEAHKRTKEIMQSPSYVIAEEDSSFLQSHETLGNRLSLDYLKAELALSKHGIKETIVVFGSTRIVEEKAAKRKLESLQAILEKEGASKKLQRRIKVAKKIVKKSRFYTIAREFGQRVGKDKEVTMMTGGGPGIMEAANRGAFDVGAKSIGLNISLPHEQFPNPYITPELCFQFHYFAIRKLHFIQRAKAVVVFPGGFGTIDEVFGILTLIQTRKIEPLPIIFVGKKYWKKIINIKVMQDEGVIDDEDSKIFGYAENAQEAYTGITRWYEDKKTTQSKES
jgi:hypothetical protein